MINILIKISFLIIIYILDNDKKQGELVLRLRVNRPVYDQDTLNQDFYYEKPKTTREFCYKNYL